MRYVLDSSVALKWVLPEADSAKAIRLRDRYHNLDCELLAPDIFPIETLHGLTKAERKRRISRGDAYPLWKSIMADVPALHPHLPLLDRSYEIASSAHIGVHDCVYVALAEQVGCELITADVRLLNALQSSFSFLVPLSALP